MFENYKKKKAIAATITFYQFLGLLSYTGCIIAIHNGKSPNGRCSLAAIAKPVDIEHILGATFHNATSGVALGKHLNNPCHKYDKSN